MEDISRISAIICTKDRPDEVLRCLASILVQSCLPDEIIIVDSSHNVELAGRLDKWAGKGKIELLYIRSDPGLPRQRNVGISKASGRIIFFFDDDVVFERDYIEEIIKVFATDPTGRIGGVMGDIHELREARQIQAWWKNPLRRAFFMSCFGNGRFLLSGSATWPYGTDVVLPTEFLCGGQVAYRRSVFENLLFDENLKGYALYEDVDFSYRESRLYQNVYTPDARCWHLMSPTARMEINELMKMQLEHFSYLFHKNLPQTWRHKIAFQLVLIGTRIVPRIEYYVWRIQQAIKGELPWTKRKSG
jgi:GT2 family glycosyltransferase